MATEKIRLDRKSDKPLYAQLRDGLLEAIADKQFRAGDRLPTVAAFAQELSVTAATVRRALKDLAETGHVVSHVGRGTFVADPASAAKPPSVTEPAWRRTGLGADPEFALAARRLRTGVSRSLEALDVLAAREGLIRFISGVGDPAIVQPDLLDKLTRHALAAGQGPYLGYGDLMGNARLRAAVAERLNRRGAKVSPDQVLITSGSQQAAAILAQLALETGRRVICETPCYLGIANAFGAMGHWVETIPRDAAGPLPDALDRFHDGRPSMLYLCPEMHNPMGTDAAPDRRAAVVGWARQQDAILIADEIFSDLRFEGDPPPSMLAEAGEDNAVVISSMSKAFLCGLRVGWLVTGRRRIHSVRGLKRAIDISSPPLMQGIALAALETGLYDDHIARAREHYRARRDGALDALARHMPDGVTWTTPAGGFHMWVELPKGYSSVALYLLAVERGVVISPGPKMDVDHRFVNAFRLSYGSVGPARIEEGVERLAGAVEALLAAGPSEPGLSGLGSYL